MPYPPHGTIDLTTVDVQRRGDHNHCGACGIWGPGNLVKTIGRPLPGDFRYWNRCRGRDRNGLYSKAKCLERTGNVVIPIPPEVFRGFPPPPPQQVVPPQAPAYIPPIPPPPQPRGNQAILAELGRMMTILDDNMDKISVGDAVELANGIKKIYDIAKPRN